MNDIIEQILSQYVFDGDESTKRNTFRKYLTIHMVERIVEEIEQ